MTMLFKFIGTFIVLAIGVVFIAALCAIPVFLLWNWLMPVIFGLGTISIFQSFGIMVLSGLLFKSNINCNK